MDQSRLDVAELQKRNPAAWTALLCRELELDVVVTAVQAVPLHHASHDHLDYRVIRYLITLEGHSDPITLIGKRTNKAEILFYREVAPQLGRLAPHCWYSSLTGDNGWLVLDDVPNHFPPRRWTAVDVEHIINDLAALHVGFWQQDTRLRRRGIPYFLDRRQYTWDELRQEHTVYFEEGPGAVLSQHAIKSVGALAPLFLKAANGLTVIRSLDGWPGIMAESHLTAAADLLDDPLPLIQPLRELPLTLLHGNPFSYHWRLTLFEDNRLIDWQTAGLGPGVYDLVSFLEQFDLLQDREGPWAVKVRQERPQTEETMIDSYLLSMNGKLGSRFDARAFRLAIPAARCLYVLINWFPYFASWFADMPNRYTWQKINRMRDEELVGTIFQPIVGFRPYLTGVFSRFLRAYRRL